MEKQPLIQIPYTPLAVLLSVGKHRTKQILEKQIKLIA